MRRISNAVVMCTSVTGRRFSEVAGNNTTGNSGFNIEDTTNYFEKMERIVRKSFNIESSEAVEEPVLNLDDEDEEEEKTNVNSQSKDNHKNMESLVLFYMIFLEQYNMGIYQAK